MTLEQAIAYTGRQAGRTDRQSVRLPKRPLDVPEGMKMRKKEKSTFASL